MVMEFSTKDLFFAFERNFNGTGPEKLKKLLRRFLGPLLELTAVEVESLVRLLRSPMDVVREAISSQTDTETKGSLHSKARYKLIIDESEDDSVMRMLGIVGLLDRQNMSLFKLSGMSEETDRKDQVGVRSEVLCHARQDGCSE